LQETPVFKEMSARKALATELPVKTVLSEHQTGVNFRTPDLDAHRRDRRYHLRSTAL
jgi:hypothetical protein